MVSIAPQATQLPAQIGTRYTVLERLGLGGMAVVYRVLDTGRDLEVALKQLIEVENADRRRKINALFEREFYVLAQLSHPSVVQAYDFGLDPAGPFYTMELLDGGDLNARAPLPFRTCCELAVQICSALSLIHSRRYLHRDLSPRNIHCSRDGRAKLIDFGAMIPMGPSRQIVGTPAFTAPEAIQGLPLDARTDLFSLGATLYFALTGHSPFAARVFEDLREAWREQPRLPSEIAPDVPPELDALVMSLLRVDPAHRPRSAFEVMQRLAAIAGIANAEAEDISQAYLQTPTLVGRDAELQHFRTRARRATEGRGGGLWLEGAAGTGRSRLLDAWVLEAKTQGMVVARAAGGAAAGRPFANAYELVEQVIEALPETTAASAREDRVFEHLFEAAEPASGRPRLLPLSRLAAERDKLPQWLTSFIQGVCRERALLIVVDDAEHIDEASLAVLAALGHAAPERALLLAVSVGSGGATSSLPALEVLARRCHRLTLRELTTPETETLFLSVFGPVPNVALVSDRVSAIAMGNPRAAMAVAQHMVDNHLIRYAEGSWLLPAELTLTELPADAEHVLRARVANLPALARRLAELQALAIAGPFGRADYAELAGADGAPHVDAALDALVQRGVLSSDGQAYTLSHGGDRALLLSAIPAERGAELHLALAAQFASTGPGLAEVHHLLMAGATDRALDRLAVLLTTAGERIDVAAIFGMNGKDVAATLERAFQFGVASARPARELYEMARMLVTLSIVTDNKLYARYAEFWVSRLKLDSGLSEYHELDASLPPADRLKQAIDAAVAHHVATPERDRAYRVDEAIRYLARYVTITIAIGARTRNAQLLHANASILEPFAPLTPLLYALWQNAIAAHEMNILGCVERARERALTVYALLGQCPDNEIQYATLIRSAIAAALAFIDAGLGLASGAQWIEAIENDPQQCVNAMYIRRIWCIVEGDTERAEYYRMRAEVLALQSSTRQMFMPPLRHELNAQIRSGDLAGVKQVADQISRMSEDEPGWLPQHHVAHGYYQRLRGDLVAAQAAFERAIDASLAGRSEATSDFLSWTAAVAGYVGVLVGRGRIGDACALGREALARCESLDIHGAAYDLVRELSIAEAKAGEHTSASQRMDALIASRVGTLRAHRIVDYEARVRVAIEAKDPKAVAHYIDLLAQHGRLDAGYVLQPRHLQLSDDARRAGVPLDLPETRFQTAVLAPRGHVSRHLAATQVATALAEALDAPARAQRALALLCEAAGGVTASGQLYLAHESGLFLAASQSLAADDALDQLVHRYWLQLADTDGATSVMTQTRDTGVSVVDVWQRPDGSRYRPIVLRSTTVDGPRRVGLAVLAANDSEPLGPQVWEIAAVLSTRLLELGDAHGVTLV
jgi:hypothetical protein